MSLLSNYITYRSSAELTVAEILRRYWADYRQKHRVTAEQARVVGAIMACRTPTLGGRIDQCDECGAMVFRYNSCRDRHCNQCQKYERAKWVAKQEVIQLPIPYFHGVFTTDHGLNPLFRANKSELYDLLFHVVSQTLQQAAKTELGCELGLTLVLHTWGQELKEHIHLHCIITGGGLSLDRRQWVPGKSKKYLVDVVKLSAAYRERLLAGIERLYRRGELETGDIDVPALLAALRAKKWEVFLKPFNDSTAVTEYLSRYVHQVAISNYRLKRLKRGRVRFEYYDNRERTEVGGKGPKKEMTIPAEEFIRRFILHILPHRFVRIRYYGLHHSSARATKLPRCRMLLGLEAALPEAEVPELQEWLAEVLGEEAVDQCPYCAATGSLFQRSRFEELPWLAILILNLVSRPTRQGVSR